MYGGQKRVNGMHGMELHGSTMRVRTAKNGKRPKSAGATAQKRKPGSQGSERRRSEPKQPHYAKPILRKMVQLARTSDVYGSFVQPTVAQSLDLIRRRIQQRSKNGAAFSSAFKRFRGDVRFLTLSSFRATMIRMGVNIPEPHYEALFNLFDNDRSGTIDFEEFSYWVMQGTADAERAAAGEAEESDDMSEAERVMLLGYVHNRLRATNTIDGKMFAHVLRGMASGRPGLIARAFKLILGRMNVGITEREALAVFNTIDQNHTGIVTVPEVIEWWETNIVTQFSTQLAAPDDPTTFEQAVMRVTQSRLTMGLDILHEAFEGYLVHSSSRTKLFYDEFRHTIRKWGLGKKERDMKTLFAFLAGTHDYITVGEFMKRTKTSYQLYNRPQHNSNGSTSRNYLVKKRRLEREMRDGLRLTYVKVKHSFEAKDMTDTGYLGLEAMKSILDLWCRPITYHDLRILLHEVPRNDADEVNYRVFLHHLHPRRAGECSHAENDLNTTELNETLGDHTQNVLLEAPRVPSSGRKSASSSIRSSRRHPRTSPSTTSSLKARIKGSKHLNTKPASANEQWSVQELPPSHLDESMDDTDKLSSSPLVDMVPQSNGLSSGVSDITTVETNFAHTPVTDASSHAAAAAAAVTTKNHTPSTTVHSYQEASPAAQLVVDSDHLFVESHKAPSTPSSRSRRPASANGRLRASSPQSTHSTPDAIIDTAITDRSVLAAKSKLARDPPPSSSSHRSASPRRRVNASGNKEYLHGDELLSSTVFARLQERLKSKWKLMKIAFHEMDTRQTGVVTKHDFQLILRIFNAYEMLNEQEFSWLSTKYQKDDNVGYVEFVKDLLQDTPQITPAKKPRPASARPPRSKPMLDSPGKSTRLRKSLLDAAEFRIEAPSVVDQTDDELADDDDDNDDNRSASSYLSVDSTPNKPSALPLLGRIAPFVVAGWKDIRVKLKALQSEDYPGNVTAADLSGILYIFGVSLSKSEAASLPKSFPLKITVRSRVASRRSVAIVSQLVDYNAFMRACFERYRA